MLVGLLGPLAALAGPVRVQIDATVDPKLRQIDGTMTVVGADITLVDPLAGLPQAPDDRTRLRLTPGRRRMGSVQFTQVEPGTWRFTTSLPRRYGDVGAWRRALYANGAWYPQPLSEGAMPIPSWDVVVHLPEGTTAALGNAVAAGEVRWRGRAERASLAVLRRGRSETLKHGGLSVNLLTRRTRRRFARRAPDALLADAVGGRLLPPVTVVEAPLRRRLTRPGPGLLYLSDRAYRLSPGLRSYHDGAVKRGLIEAALPIDTPFERALAASALARVSSAPSASGLLKWFAWNPVIDAILNDRRLPFWADIFNAAHPEDPLRDDLVERFAPHGPTTALAAQLEAAAGRPALRALADGLIAGESAENALSAAGVAPGLTAGWRRAYPEQDLRLQVRDRQATVTRDAPPGAGPELVQLRVGKDTVSALVEAGETWTVPLPDGSRSAVVDPGRLIRQTSRQGDAWPPRFVWLWAAWIDSISITERYASGSATVWARGRDDTRNIWSLSGSIDQQDLPSLSVGWLHRRGPLQDGLARPHRFSAWVTPAWSNPRFAEGDRAVFTLGGGVGYAWDTRVSALFPLRGQRLAITVSGGLAPDEGTTWAAVRTAAGGVVSPHPRWAFAGRLSAAAARGDTVQRLLWIGGPGVGVSLTPGAEIGDLRGVVQGEVRWAPIRHASVPLLGLAWLSEIQLTAGAEALTLRTVDGPWARGVGLTAGTAVVVDLLGAKPGILGVTAGVPAWVEGVEAAKAWERPQVTLRFGQSF